MTSTTPSVLEIKPNRLLLDSSFDGYKLSLEEIPVSRKNLETPVDKILLNSSQYSFLHAKLFGLHNHLISDKYDGFNSVYFIDKSLNVQKTYIDSYTHDLINPITVYSIPRPREQKSGDYNVTFCFASPQLAVVSDGMGTIYILGTRDKKDDDSFETLFAGKVLDNEEQGFLVTDAMYHESSNQLHVLLLHIEEDPIERFVSVIHWLTFKEIKDVSDSWGQTALRRLKTKGEIQYLHLEEEGDHIYIVSENDIRFELNSEHPVNTEEDNTSSNSTTKDYKWSQTLEDISVEFSLPEDAEKTLINVKTEVDKINIEYGTKVLLAGELHEKIDPNLTTWTVEPNNLLVVNLNKQENSEFWNELVKGDTKGEYVLNSCIIDQVNDTVGRFRSDGQQTETTPQSGTTFNSQQIEECDFESDKSETFSRISSITNSTTHKIHLGSHQVILKPYLNSHHSRALGIRHDVDVCLWQPFLESGNFEIKHEGTLLAFGYVQASKQNRKFVTCSPNLEYAVICETSGHIFIYKQNKPLLSVQLRNRTTGRRIKNIAQQQVFNLPNQDIHGLFASNTHLFLLGEDFILSLRICNPTQ
ncbi:nudC domain-containing protein 1 [Sitophilus oryzae]|uniref:NudC domain-containing protein 1 n=1 Tax=Sitophilus oryzae TaxID=7048 RepID=A0A6J2XDU9_SITOR|nr:nudC domain-containing protein 1 [Sitophilus oryzae]